MKIEEIQHGGDHYKDQPKYLQPIWLATALNLNPMEYSVLKYLLRHRKKGGFEDLKKMVHFAQMLMEHEYGVCPVVVYPEQDSPSDVSGEEVALEDCADAEKVVDPDPCPFKVGDIIEHRADIENRSSNKWQVVGLTSQCMYVVRVGDFNHATHISNKFWWKYRWVATAATVDSQQKLPKYPLVGEVYKGKASGKTFRVFKVQDEYIWLEDCKSQRVHTVNWKLGASSDYERMPDEPIRFTRDKLPQVGDRYKRLNTDEVYRITDVNNKGVVRVQSMQNQMVFLLIDWELYFDMYERATDETE